MTSSRSDTPVDAIEPLFRDLRRAFNDGRSKPIAWRKQQIERIYQMCDEQKGLFASAAHADFHRPNSETLLFDCGSVSCSLTLSRTHIPRSST